MNARQISNTLTDVITRRFSFRSWWRPAHWLIRDDVAAGRPATVLDHLPSHVFDSHALWPQTTHLPLRVRLAIDALAAALPEATSLQLHF